jgi:hypothetical protein
MILPSYRLLPRILRWFCRFRQRRGYGVHSPFAFEWITDVVYLQKAQYYAYAPLAEQHEAWQGVLSVKDARLLFRIANHQRAQRMLVVGQGIEREIHYLQAARPSAQIVHLPDASSVEKALSSETSPEQPFDFVLWLAAESPSLPVLSHLCTRMTEHAANMTEGSANLTQPSVMMSEHPDHLLEHPEKTLEFFQKTSEIFPKTWEISEKMSENFLKTSDVSVEPSAKSTPTAVLAPTAVFVLLCPHADESRKQTWQRLQQSAFSTVSFDLYRFGVAFYYPKLQRQHYVVNYF